MSPEEVPEAALQLIKAGVSGEDAARLLGAVEGSPALGLFLLPLPGEPREGDRLRPGPRADGSQPRALKVAAVAPAGARWAVVAEPVRPGSADDLPLPRGIG